MRRSAQPTLALPLQRGGSCPTGLRPALPPPPQGPEPGARPPSWHAGRDCGGGTKASFTHAAPGPPRQGLSAGAGNPAAPGR